MSTDRSTDRKVSPAPGSDPAEARHPIGVVARRTGLKPDLIRAWERRYAAVTPQRSDTRRRFYSDADIERLRLLRDATTEGRAISQVAELSADELVALIAEDKAEKAEPEEQGSEGVAGDVRPAIEDEDAAAQGEQILSNCLAAVRRLDPKELERQLERASVALSRIYLLQRLLVPLMHSIGDLWQEGSLRPAHEHMASSVVRSFVGHMQGTYQEAQTAPHLVATTPARQHHELGALIVAAIASSEGWNVTYLGPDLPAEEIAAAVQQKGALALALSVTYPPDDPVLPDELRRLRRLLGKGVKILVGGRAVDAYRGVLDDIGAAQAGRIEDLRHLLGQMRSSPVAS